MDEDIGQALRVARKTAGLSIAQLARSITFSESHLRSVENGNRKITHEVVGAYDKALGLGGILVDLFVAGQDDDLKRRTALSLLGTITAVGVSAPRVIAESLRESILFAVGADDWQDITIEYGRRFMIDSPEVFRQRLTGDLLVLRQAISTSDSSNIQLAAPRLLMLHGMVSANLGNIDDAARWYRAARLAADRTGNDQLRGWVRGREAFRRGYEGAAPSEVLLMSADVQDVEAKLATAQAYARVGERTEALRSLRNAHQIHAITDQSETTIYAMPPWRMALSAAYVYALLGDVNDCESQLATVRPPTSVQRWEPQLEIQRAVALARSGDIIAGIQSADKVMHATPKDERSAVLIEMYREVKVCAARS
ncbi:MAG TPA: helix-turn-helix transcriptional regulator [Streptosporangiaceae bacterium]